jgi:beta-galactosidase
LKEGTNLIRAVGRQDRAEIGDEIQVGYTTQSWGPPAILTLATVAQTNDVTVVEARALDQSGKLCLDAANLVRFAATGDGQLLDHLGTVNGSRAVQLCNGRARISMRLTGPKAVVSLASTGLPTAFLTVTEEAPTGSKKLVDAGSPKRE